MKANTTAVWIEDGCGKQMIEVYKHREQKDHIHPAPISAKKQPGNQAGHEQMKAVVDEGLHNAKVEINCCLRKAHKHQ